MNRHIAKEAVEDMTAEIEWLLSNHHLAITEIDEEARVIIDLWLKLLMVMWHNSGQGGLNINALH